MPHDEAKEVIAKGLKEISLPYSEDDLDKYVRHAGGYPHALQILGHNLVEMDSDNNIDEKDCPE